MNLCPGCGRELPRAGTCPACFGETISGESILDRLAFLPPDDRAVILYILNALVEVHKVTLRDYTDYSVPASPRTLAAW